MLQFNPLKVECTLFFEENPYTLETAEGLALRLGRKTAELVLILEHLVTDSILEKIGDGEQAIYRYVQPDNFQIPREFIWE
ncbi:hypothetical protein J27TS8_24210 [Robertmurraya siralis]|uniref:Uncharacterized protein n=1 Tax=Robertmurraya siralis TaxID=77777 RepID=A0A919WI30_9BACI|nr:hypothetical protein [Robertmurraya siralis]PAE20596.1 hypothetical protein CHH80_11350 [Bacillus sp. 7504-2]GIN62428.1 hypothetical protein J27TS8_24210 [Robertmurraya siralis]